jgi:tryptophan synthase beta subunit
MKNVDIKGFYGKFGGSFIPEMLWPNIKELENNYQNIIMENKFKHTLQKFLKDYVGRPTPLFYCEELSKKYKTKIYLKREDLNHTGAHKINNTVGQALLAKKLGKKKIIAETGAGQHGVATASVCSLLDIECIIFMGDTDIKRQAINVDRIKMLGATIIPVNKGTLKDAVNEALRYWINNPESYYLIGSVVGPHPYPNLVTFFQSIISEEIQQQLNEKEGCKYPDYLISSVGGGSNAAGAFYHFIENFSVKLIAAEAAGLGLKTNKTASTTFNGSKGVLHGSMTLLMQDKYGQIIEPYSISAGLDYPGIGPMHSHLFHTKRAQFISITDDEAIQAGYELSCLQGIIPAIESAHALAILPKLNLKNNEVIVINLSGRGEKDMESYINYINHVS